MTMEQCLTLAVKRYLDQNVHATAVFLAERLVAENASEDNLGLLADAYYRSGAGHRAISLLERHMTSNQGILSAHNRYLLALCCFEADRISDAENALIPSMSTRRSTGEGATKNVPNGAAGLYLLGRVHRRLHRTDQAIECFTESLKLDPFLWSSFENLCELGSQASASLFFGGVSTNPSKVHLDENNIPPPPPPPSVSRRIHSRVQASTNTSHARGKKALSRTITEQGASHQSNTKLEGDTTSSQHPLSRGEGDVLRLLSLCGAAYQHICLYQCADALTGLQSLPPHHIQTSWVQHQMGRAYFELAQYPQAAMAFERMRALSPDRLDGVSIYSTTLWHLKKEVDLSYLAQQVTSHKTSAEAWCVAGNCFSLQKEHDVALDFFTRAIQVDPTFPYAYTLAGHEYVSNEDFDKAVACFRQALRVDPRHYNAWCGLGTIYFKQEKLAVADYHFGRAVAINPHSSLLHCFRGVVLHALTKDDDALAALDTALALNATNLVARYHKADIFVAHGRLDEALVELHRVEAAAPKDYTVHFTLGSVYTKLGRVDRALQHLNHALVFSPNDCHADVKAAIDALYDDDDDIGASPL
ncbi:hypothetical protein H257_04549 [Aphanomyces astaci]|uniref:Uncharacterized protein n=1 Tax=Aphanomyces astaci TaxID=112090 RepID=W4GTV5_APHAT|nr:hypothetical protein H257_04549 [Aphanomyces astaci]ETV82751.1 hypothetical protein H257_04549 [Aphanomyces astaci]|eukprot:XP_009827422.1 hypothetical protein H257_04549 [Aphanomyces astaci]